MGISFAQSGQGELKFGLEDVRELALAHGFAKPGAPKDAPPAARADLDKFFASFDCKALSTFKKRFCTEALAPPVFGAKPAAKAAPLPTGFKARRCSPRRVFYRRRCVRRARRAPSSGVRAMVLMALKSNTVACSDTNRFSSRSAASAADARRPAPPSSSAHRRSSRSSPSPASRCQPRRSSRSAAAGRRA
jgi:hypothetical protein